MITKKDLLSSLITGVLTGFVAWQVFAFLGRSTFLGVSLPSLVILVPLLWLVIVALGNILSRWVRFLGQFAKFVVIGFTNAAVDFGIFNLLIAFTGSATGVWFSVFKTASFVAALLHSYFWNRYWAFKPRSEQPNAEEFLKFSSVALFSMLVNVGVASLIVNFGDGASFGFDDTVWANISAAAGAVLSMLFNFVGYKFVVFKK